MNRFARLTSLQLELCLFIPFRFREIITGIRTVHNRVQLSKVTSGSKAEMILLISVNESQNKLGSKGEVVLSTPVCT
jgi:hypothetical protein